MSDSQFKLVLEPAPASLRKYRLTLLLAAVAVLLGGVWLAWSYNANPNIALLTAHPPAEWILYPKPRDGGGLYRAVEINTVFRREFTVDHPPANAVISIRALKRWQMTVNGSAVDYIAAPEGNWKNATLLDIAPKLHAGTNLIEVTVFNTNGPPALWLHLAALGIEFGSDTNWASSLWLADWKPAQAASARTEFPPGSLMDGGERPWPSFVKSLPVLLGFALVSAAVLFFGRSWCAARLKTDSGWENKFSWLMAGLAALLWIALYFHNVNLLPYQLGFDSADHLQYIDYIRSKGALPLATEGWQMYQPPLYYLISTVLVSVFNATTNAEMTGVLRCFGCAIGTANFLFIFLSLRLLFPNRLGAQLVGLILGAFVAENLYMSQYVSNEALCGMLASAAIYLGLHILKTASVWPRMYSALGLMLGAALLAKFSALLIFPFVGAALAAERVRQRNFSPRTWLDTVGITFATAAAVCAWHYYRVWHRLGSPMVGNWDAASGHIWWMEDGYHTPAYFFRFGRCLAYPWFSGFDGFADGLYSTLWGDGLWDGMTSLPDRGPWNYDLMAGGYLLALLPTGLIAVGAALAIKQLFRQWDTAWMMVTGIAGGTFAALALMCLKVPTYGSAKAFYGLVALMPLCAFAALAWETVSRRWKPVGLLLAGGLGVWALASYSSFWIRDSSPATHILLGRFLKNGGQTAEARREYDRALKLAPASGRAKCLVGGLLPDPAESLAMLKAAVELDPRDAESHSQLALAYHQLGQIPEALREDQAAISLAPNLTAYHLIYSEHLFALKRYDEAIAAARRALDLMPLFFKFHYGIGLALDAQGKYAEARVHLEHATTIAPNQAEIADQYGVCLSALGRVQEAVTNYSRAVRLQPTNTDMLYHLATALSADGHAAAAVAEYHALLQINPDSPVALNNLAWILAANADARVRNGPEAVQLAARACELTGGKYTQFLGTLAAAYAEAGQFDEAQAAAKKAIDRAQTNGEKTLAETNRKLLAVYESYRAYHEGAGPGR